jgi:hypothetical protein
MAFAMSIVFGLATPVYGQARILQGSGLAQVNLSISQIYGPSLENVKLLDLENTGIPLAKILSVKWDDSKDLKHMHIPYMDATGYSVGVLIDLLIPDFSYYDSVDMESWGEALQQLDKYTISGHTLDLSPAEQQL